MLPQQLGLLASGGYPLPLHNSRPHKEQGAACGILFGLASCREQSLWTGMSIAHLHEMHLLTFQIFAFLHL